MSGTGYTGTGVILAFHEGGLHTAPYVAEDESPHDAARRTYDALGRGTATVAVTLGPNVWAWKHTREQVASENYSNIIPSGDA